MAKLLVFSAFALLQILHLNAFDSRRFATGERQPQIPGQNGGGDRGTWGVTINKDKGIGPQIRTDAQGNIWTSRDGNWQVDGHGHHEAGKGRKPSYGGGVEVKGRWRREAENDVQEFHEAALEADTAELTQEARQKRSPQRDRGSIGVTVNKDQGRGPQVRTDARGNIYTSPNGKFNVEGHGHHEFGRGRKPDYGAGVQAGGNIYTSPKGNWKVDGTGNYDVGRGSKPSYGAGVSVIGRFRRQAEEIFGDDVEAVIMNEEGCEHREKRSTQQVSKSGDRGSWGVSVNKDKGRGPQVKTEGKGNVYKSPNGNVKVDVHGQHEFGKGRKPSYGGGATVSGRWRRDIAEEFEKESEDIEGKTLMKRSADPNDKSPVNVHVSYDKSRGPHIRTEAERNIYRSPNGNFEVNGRGFHEAGRGMKPNYGVYIGASGRFRREANPQSGKGSIDISVNKDKGRGPQIRTDAQKNIYTSKNGNWRVDGGGYHEAGKGRKPSHGGQISVSGRF